MNQKVEEMVKGEKYEAPLWSVTSFPTILTSEILPLSAAIKKSEKEIAALLLLDELF